MEEMETSFLGVDGFRLAMMLEEEEMDARKAGGGGRGHWFWLWLWLSAVGMELDVFALGAAVVLGFDTDVLGFDTVVVDFGTGVVGFDTAVLGFCTAVVRFDTDVLGFGIGVVGFGTGEVGFDTGVLGFDTGALGFDSGVLDFGTGVVGFDTGLEAGEDVEAALAGEWSAALEDFLWRPDGTCIFIPGIPPTGTVTSLMCPELDSMRKTEPAECPSGMVTSITSILTGLMEGWACTLEALSVMIGTCIRLPGIPPTGTVTSWILPLP